VLTLAKMSGAELAAWIGVAVMMVTLVAVIVIAVKQRRRRVLVYTANTEYPLVSPPLRGEGIEIFAYGRKLAAPHRLLFTLLNVGNEAVRSSHFEAPLGVRFADAAVIDIQIETNVDGLVVKAAASPSGGIDIEPVMLNPREGFALSALVDGCPHECHVEARIADAEVRNETHGGSVGDAVVQLAGLAARGSTPGVLWVTGEVIVEAFRTVGQMLFGRGDREDEGPDASRHRYPTTRGRGPDSPS
jgi:hypothetical protein